MILVSTVTILLLFFPHAYGAIENGHKSETDELEAELDAGMSEVLDEILKHRADDRFIDIPTVQFGTHISKHKLGWAEKQNGAGDEFLISANGEGNEKLDKFNVYTEFSFPNIMLDDLGPTMTAKISREGKTTVIFLVSGRLMALFKLISTDSNGITSSVVNIGEEVKSWKNILPRFVKYVHNSLVFGNHRKRLSNLNVNVALAVTGNGIENLRIRNRITFNGDTKIYPIRSAPWENEINCNFEKKPIKDGEKRKCKAKFNYQKPIKQPMLGNYLNMKPKDYRKVKTEYRQLNNKD